MKKNKILLRKLTTIIAKSETPLLYGSAGELELINKFDLDSEVVAVEQILVPLMGNPFNPLGPPKQELKEEAILFLLTKRTGAPIALFISDCLAGTPELAKELARTITRGLDTKFKLVKRNQANAGVSY